MALDIQTGRFDKMEVDFKPEDFKGQWSHIEIAGVKTILTQLLTEEGLINHEDSTDESKASDFFQLAFISSGEYAGLHVTTSEIAIEDNELNAFLIRNNNQLIAQCFDADEEYVYYEVK